MAYEHLLTGISLSMTGGVLITWIVLCCLTEGWLNKTTVYYTLSAGLFEVTLSQGVASMVASEVVRAVSEEAATELANLQHKTFGLQAFREYMCAIPKIPTAADTCTLWTDIQMATWALLSLVILGGLLLLVGACLDAHYHFVRARARARKVIRLLYSIAPVLFMAGVVQYFFLAGRISDMPPVTQSTGLGPNVGISALISLFSWVPLAVAVAIGETMDEVINEDESAERHFLKEANLEYGATQSMHPQDHDPTQSQAIHLGGGGAQWGMQGQAGEAPMGCQNSTSQGAWGYGPSPGGAQGYGPSPGGAQGHLGAAPGGSPNGPPGGGPHGAAW